MKRRITSLLIAAMALVAAVPRAISGEGVGAGRLDPVAKLSRDVAAGRVDLEFEPQRGYLAALLDALEIPVSSQTLVFSKTSAQFRLISPESPRAIYFNDDVYVGWVPGGPFLEVSAADPQGGGVFYTLSQQPGRARFERDNGSCLQCHESGRTMGIPGHLVRSVYPSRDGTPHFGAGTIDVDESTPFNERFGGWYVTGSHAQMIHRGNVTIESADDVKELEAGPGSGWTDLSGRIDVDRYLSPHSDLVAHLLLAHQTQMHNAIALAHLETRKALAYRDEMARVFGESSEHVEASVKRRIAAVGEKLLRRLLFADEALLEGPVEGTSGFAEQFQSRSPRDSRGRSLRDLDLETRLLRHPCSYLIYSDAFAALPDQVKEYVFGRLWQVLAGADAAEFPRLSPEDRRAIREILEETLPEAKRRWSAGSAS